MASYLSHPREFSPYIPQVSTELYSSLLAKKDQAYNQGVQKIENSLTQVASLPVARSEDRDYLQQKMTSITSELNNQVGVDWSNQHLNNITNTHIAAISNDPKIQTAVQGAMRYKSDYQAAKADKQDNGERAIYNNQKWQEDVNNWMTTPGAGVPYNTQYTGYTDIDAPLMEAFKAKHPNTRISVRAAGWVNDPKTGELKFDPKKVVQMWDEEVHTWKGISPQDVKSVLDSVVQSRPDVKKQLEINAWGTYRQATPEVVVGIKQNVLKNRKEILTRYISDLDQEIGIMKPDDPSYGKYKKERELAQHNIDEEIDPNLTEQAKNKALDLYDRHPEVLDQEKKDTYMTQWYNNQIKKYAYGEDGLDFKGNSPSEKQHWSADHDIKLQELQLHKEANDRAWQKYRDAKAIAEQKQKKEYEEFVTQKGASTKTMNPLEAFTTTYNKAREEISSKKNTYLYNTYHNDFPDYFQNGLPTKEGSDKLEELYSKRQQAFKNGNNKDDNNQPVALEQRDFEFFKDMEGTNKVSLAMQGKLDETDNAWKKEFDATLSREPRFKTYMDQYKSNPEQVSKAVIGATKIYDDLLKRYAKEGFTQQASDEATKTAKQYGFSSFAQLENLVVTHKQFADAYRDVQKEETAWKDNYLKANDYIVNPQSTLWVDKNLKDPHVNAAIVQKAMKLVPNGKSSILKAHPGGEGIQISYIQEPVSGDYTMEVSNNTGDVETHPVSINDVPSEWTNYKDESTAAQLLRVNRDPHSTYSTTYGKAGRSFKAAEPLITKMYEGKPTALKYGIIKEGNKYTVEFWARDASPNSNTNPHIISDPRTGIPIQGSSNSIKQIQSMINNFAANGSIVPVGYSQYITPEEPEND